jgi:hypothetical protein
MRSRLACWSIGSTGRRMLLAAAAGAIAGALVCAAILATGAHAPEGGFAASAAGNVGEARLTLNNATLAELPSGGAYRGVLRLGVNTPSDSGPPVLYVSQGRKTCAALGYAADGAGCVNTGDGGSYLAQLGHDFDIRAFGARTCAGARCTVDDFDNAMAIEAAEAYVEAHGGCAVVPSGLPFRVTRSALPTIDGTGAGLAEKYGRCLHGVMAGSEGQFGASAGTSEIQISACVDGAAQYDDGSQPREDNWRLYDLTITSLCAGSTHSSAVPVAGLHLGYGTGYDVHNVMFKDWVRCRWFESNGTGQDFSSRVQCIDQDFIPNRRNGYPQFGTLIDTDGPGQMQFHIDEATTDFPGNEEVASYRLPTGTGGAYTGTVTLPAGYGYLDGAYGIQVRVDGVLDPNLGTDYVLADATPGAPDPAIFGRLDLSKVTGGSPRVMLSSTAGLPAGIAADPDGPPWCRYFPVIGVLGNGIEPQTCVIALTGSAATLSKPVQPYVNGPQELLYEQLFIADRESGCNVDRSSPIASTSRCGHVIAISFQPGHFPRRGARVSALYNDPWADACLAILHGAADNDFSGYAAGGCRYGVVEATQREHIDLRYFQIGYASSYIFPAVNGDGDYISIPHSSPGTVMVAPGYPLDGAAGTNAVWQLCFAGVCTANPGGTSNYRRNYYYNPGSQLAGRGAAVAAADTLYLHPAWIRGLSAGGRDGAGRSPGVQGFSAYATAAGAGARVKYCLYGRDRGGDGPGYLLTSSPPVAITRAGDVNANAGVLPVYLHPGVVWIGSMYAFAAAPAMAQVSDDPALSASIKGATGASSAIVGGELFNGVTYGATNLFERGCPYSLAGLTTPTNAIPIPEVAWMAY